MNTYVVLLRGINVGGRNKLLMKDLIVILKGLGCTNVRTYIQSGNVVLQNANNDTPELSKEITQAISQKHDFEPHVHILRAKDIQQAIDNSPYQVNEGKTLHFGFLETEPKAPDLSKLKALKTNSEKFKLDGRVFYLFAPDGIGRSKLAANIEKCMGVSVTSRNLNTVIKLMGMSNKS